AHGHHADVGFLRHYVFSTDHKMIGRQFFFTSLFMILIGGFMAMMMRHQLAWPEQPMPFISWIGEPYVYADPEAGFLAGAFGPEFYNSLFTMHATIMIFFVVMPMMVGAFGNFLIPLMIGTRDMAFPVLNMLSYWVFFIATAVMLTGFFVPGGHAAAGWTAYAPLSAVPEYSGVDLGQTLWSLSLIIMGVSSMMGSINYITTIINMRAPGMTYFRLPLVIWSLWITAILLLLALPVFTSALGMLVLDRALGTSFFKSLGGGEPILWQHLFWFFGHPEVYVLVLPAMGVTSDVLSTFSRKPIFGYHAMVYSMIAIAFLSWVVWGHHMFQSGMNPVLGNAFMISTMVIAVPSAIKTFNWLGTIWGGQIRFTAPMINALSFVSTFTIGGLSGIFMASTPVDIFIHDTYYIVAHFHYVVAGIVFAMFAAINYWFPKMFGRMMNETIAKAHAVLTFVFFNLTFFPMHILGVGGHMRRIYNPLQYEFLQGFQSMNVFITYSAFLLGATQLLFIANVVYGLFFGKKAVDNPWEANTLDWSAPTPPPHGNFAKIPTVYRGPYEFSSPDSAGDFLPQHQEPGPGARAAVH
ncbi:MAG: cytochrome c oxidase subunit I, partial [Candidatus Binatia bacterium]